MNIEHRFKMPQGEWDEFLRSFHEFLNKRPDEWDGMKELGNLVNRFDVLLTIARLGKEHPNSNRWFKETT